MKRRYLDFRGPQRPIVFQSETLILSYIRECVKLRDETFESLRWVPSDVVLMSSRRAKQVQDRRRLRQTSLRDRPEPEPDDSYRCSQTA